MLSKEEAKEMRTSFWNVHNRKMSRLRPKFEGAKDWTPYPTRVRGMMFRQDFTNKEVVMSFELRHPDPDIREIQWEQLLEVRKLLEENLGHELVLEPDHTDKHGVCMARAYHHIEGCSIFDRDTWERASEYLRNNSRGFDEFWAEFFDLFKSLEK